MNINQNNYESFFLLYVDNELSATDKLSVETFIEQNPHLAAELQILQDMVLPVDENAMADKTALYRSEALEGNFQEAMLFHLDNELREPARTELLRNIEADANMQSSWEQLKKTKLDSTEEIAFPHKKSLYRREKSGSVIYGGFTRWAVAAAFIAAGFFAGIIIIKQRNNVVTEVADINGTKPVEKVVSPALPADTVPDAKDQKELVAENNLPASEPSPNKSTEVGQVASNIVNDNSVRRVTPNSLQGVERTAGKPAKELRGMVQVKQDAPLVATNEKLHLKKPDPKGISTTLAAVEKPKQPVEIMDRDMTPTESSYAYSTLMEEPQQNDNHILFMDEETVARTKAGVFLKKLKRTVTRSTNIKTGNSLKIAGFEFAVK